MVSFLLVFKVLNPSIPLNIIFCLLITSSIFKSQDQQPPNTTRLFVQNKGQLNDENFASVSDLLYYSPAGAGYIYLRKNGVSYQLGKSESTLKNHFTAPTPETLQETNLQLIRLDLNFLNSSTECQIKANNAGKDKLNFYRGKRVSENVDVYESIKYINIYDKIDLIYYRKNGVLKYDFLLATGADPRNIQVEVVGAEKIEVLKNGRLSIHTKLGDIIEEAPLVYQGSRSISARWRVKGNTFTFDISHYDRSLPIVIDPLIRTWGTYYGGGEADRAYATCTDKGNNVFITGYLSFDGTTVLSTPGVYQTLPIGGGNAFLAKFDSMGQRVWCTYYGGKNGGTLGFSCAADTAGFVFMAGQTWTTDSALATPGSFQSGAAGYQDAFLVKLNKNGQRDWATFYGTAYSDWASSCSVDQSGNVYLTGRNGDGTSNKLATPGAFQTQWGQTFLVKFSSAGNRLWATYYTGNGSDYKNSACATDQNDNVFLTGQTWGYNALPSTLIATPASYQPTYGGGQSDIFVAKFDSTGARLWGTFFGGPGSEHGVSCATDQSGAVFVAGYTSGTITSQNITTHGCHQPVSGGGYYEGLIVKFSSTGSRLWCSFYGGNGNDQMESCATDLFGNVYVAGSTESSNGTVIASSGAHQSQYNGGSTITHPHSGDAFLVQFDQNGSRLAATYYGGTSGEAGHACATDNTGAVYLAGLTMSSGNPTVIASPSGFQQQFGNGLYVANSYTADAFLVKFENCTLDPPLNNTASQNATICAGNATTLTVLSSGPVNWYSNYPSGTPLGSGLTFVTGTLSPGSYTWYTKTSGSCQTDTSMVPVPVTVVFNPVVGVSQGSVCPGESFTIQASGATTYSFTGGNAVVTPTSSSNFTVVGFNATGCSDTAVSQVIVYPSPTIMISAPLKTVCSGEDIVLTGSGGQFYYWQGAIGNSIIVTPTANTTYTLTGTDHNGCSSTVYYHQKVSPCIGVTDNQLTGNKIEIFPNPSNGLFSIQLSEDTNVLIYDMLGSSVYDSRLSSGSSQMDLQHLAKGAYFLRAGSTVTKVIIR